MKMLGRIYVIKSNETDKVYIGSTIQSLSERFRCHKKDYKSWLNGDCHYVSSFEIIQYSDAFIELLEEVDVGDKTELHKIEGRYIKDNMNCVNKRVAGRDQKQYRIDNREQRKQYYQDNKEQILEKYKQYYQDNKEKLKEQAKQYRIDNKEQISEYEKQYRIDHKEQISEYKKQYRIDHKEQISEYKKQKVTCECGANVIRCHISRHRKSLKHKEYIESK